MARFLKSPQQTLIPMGSPVNVDFYSQILDRAQQNLERGTAIKAAELEKLSNLPFLSQEDMDATYGKVQNRLKGVIENPDFVSPTRISQAVMSANTEVLPGIQAVKAKAAAAEEYKKMRMAYGPDFWGGVDPAEQSILDTSGKYVNPNTFKARGINASEVDKKFLADQNQELTYSFDSKVKSDLAGYHKINKYSGLSDERREQLYNPNSPKAREIAKAQLESMPELREVFGSEEEAIKRLVERNYQTSGNYKQSVDSQYLTDRNYIDADGRARAAASTGGGGTRLFTPIAGDVTQTNVISDALSSYMGNSEFKMNSSEISFDASGKLARQQMLPYKALKNNPYKQAYSTPGSSTQPSLSPKEEIEMRTKNIAQSKLITDIRKNLSDNGLMVTKDATGKIRSRTDKEAYDLYTTAVNNSTNMFGVNYQIHPGMDIVGANPFFSTDGKRKDFRNANIEVDLNDGRGWTSIDEGEFANQLGYDLKDGEDKKAYTELLKDVGSEVYDFSNKNAKIRSAIMGNNGKDVSIRYDAPKEVINAKQGVVKLHEAFTKPVSNMKVPVAMDATTNRPVILTVNSKIIQDDQGNPFIYPEVEIPEDTELGKYLSTIYQKQGYGALISEMQSMTDDSLFETNNVYARSTSNLKSLE